MQSMPTDWLVAGTFALFGLVSTGLVLVGLPGAWLTIAAAIAIDLLQSNWMPAGAPLVFHPITLAVAVAIAALGEILEFALSAAGARRFGASRAGMVGSIIGGLIGAVAGTFLLPVPVVGTLTGALIGTAIGAIVGEVHAGKSLQQSARPAAGAVIGRALGTLAKLPCAAAVWLLLAIAAFVA